MNHENLKERLIELKSYINLILEDKETKPELRYAFKAIEIILENLIADNK